MSSSKELKYIKQNHLNRNIKHIKNYLKSSDSSRAGLADKLFTDLTIRYDNKLNYVDDNKDLIKKQTFLIKDKEKDIIKKKKILKDKDNYINVNKRKINTYRNSEYYFRIITYMGCVTLILLFIIIVISLTSN